MMPVITMFVWEIVRWIFSSDGILFLTFLAIIWYTIETRKLRIWQKKGVRAALLNLELQRLFYDREQKKNVGDTFRWADFTGFPEKANDILKEEEGIFSSIKQFFVCRCTKK